MSEEQQQAVMARGTLAETPLCHVALYLYRHTCTGTLVIDRDQRTEARLRFARGRVTGARLPVPGNQLLDSLLPMCGLRAGTFEFFEADVVGDGEDVIEGVVDPYELLVASLKDFARDDMVDAVLTRYGSTRLRLQPGRDLERLRLSSEDMKLIELLRALPASPEELVGQSPLRPARTRRIVYALLATHMVGPHQERSDQNYRSQVDLGLNSPQQPAPTINEVAASTPPAWQRLASMLPAAGSSSLRPGGPPSATIRPNGSGPVTAGISSLRPGAIAAAPVPRGGSSQIPGAASPSASPPSDDPVAVARRADMLLGRGRIDDAIAALDPAIAANPKEGELYALRAQALFERHRAEEEVPSEVVEAVKLAIEIDRDNARALFTRGMLHKRGGDNKKALAYFKRVVSIAPKHLEAQREIRLAKLRQ